MAAATKSAAARKYELYGKEAFYSSAPLEDIICAGCGAGNCLMYPGKDGSAAVICPSCSDATTEDLVRHVAEGEGFNLKAVRVFAVADPLAEYRTWEAELPDWAREDLEAAWHASADGTDCSGYFGYTDEGPAYPEGGPKPSYALAIHFDRENWAAGRDHVLSWVDDREQVAAA